MTREELIGELIRFAMVADKTNYMDAPSYNRIRAEFGRLKAIEEAVRKLAFDHEHGFRWGAVGSLAKLQAALAATEAKP